VQTWMAVQNGERIVASWSKNPGPDLQPESVAECAAAECAAAVG
jgi:hypothetical protein